MVLNRREMLSSLQHSNSHANKWNTRAPVWQHQPHVQIETVVCSFDTRSTSTWTFAEKECWLGAISESSPCEKGWISVLLQFFNLGLQVLLLSAQRIENTYSSLPAGGSCNLASTSLQNNPSQAKTSPLLAQLPHRAGQIAALLQEGTLGLCRGFERSCLAKKSPTQRKPISLPEWTGHKKSEVSIYN